jgi:hypothetical protein
MQIYKINTNKLSGITIKFFLLYIFLFYFIPFISHIIFREEYNLVFKSTTSMLPVLYIVVFFFAVLFLEKFTHSKKLIYFNKIGRILEFKFFNFILLFLFFLFSLNFFVNYNLTFRHSGGKTVSGEGVEIIILLALKSYFKAYLFFILLKTINKLEIRKNEYFNCLLICICYILCMMASLDMLYIIIAFILGIKKQKILFVKNERKLRILPKFFKLLLLLILVISVVFVGNANKTGADKATEKFTDINQTTQIYINTVRRISTWYISVVILGEKDIFDNERALESLNGIISNTNGRIKTIMGSEADFDDRKKVWSVNRMNYLQIFYMDTRDRTGASPGIIASSFYLPFFPFNFLIMIIYTIVILRYFNKGFQNINKEYKFSPLLNIIILFFLIPMFESPVDLINFIGHNFIYSFLFISLLDRIIVLVNLEKQT